MGVGGGGGGGETAKTESRGPRSCESVLPLLDLASARSESTFQTLFALCPLPPHSGSPHLPLPACPALRSMQPLGPEGTPALRRRPLLHLLLLVLLLVLMPPPITRAQTTPGTPSSRIPPATPSAPSLRERVRALMRDFPLVDGCVGVVWGRVETEPTLKLGKEFSACRTSEETPLHHPWTHSPILHGCLFPSSVTTPLVGSPQPSPQRVLV